MFLLIPFGHDRLTVSQLPFATIGIILLCFVIYFSTSSIMEDEMAAEQAAGQAFEGYSAEHDYLKLSEEVLEKKSKSRLEVYQKRQEWLALYLESPDEVDQFLEDHLMSRRAGGPDIGRMAEMLQNIPGVHGAQSAQLQDIKRDYLLGAQAKFQFLMQLKPLSPADIDAHQEELNKLYVTYLDAKESSILSRFGFVPADASVVGIFTHQFLHGGFFHLLFNMIFLWLAAVKLEDRWTRPIFCVSYLFFGAVGALTHAYTHEDSAIPMIGASGAVAGLMGAFLVKYGRAEIQFLYFYWLFLKPKFGKFSAPAFLMLPLWFVGELFWAFMDFGPVAYWAHVGGFLAGVAVALLFRFGRVEEDVLGLEPEVDVRPEDEPLVAFENAPPVSLGSDRKPAAVPGLTVAVEMSPAVAEQLPRPEPVPKPEPVRLDFEAFMAERIVFEGIGGTTGDGRSRVIGAGEVTAIGIGRIDRITEDQARKHFSSGLVPGAPAFVCALLLHRPIGGPVEKVPCSIIDGAHVPYAKMLGGASASPGRNVAAFIRLMMKTFPEAEYIPAPGQVGEHNLPVYRDLDHFFGQLARFAQ
jgi:membrane associated rhomboid family serine protease